MQQLITVRHKDFTDENSFQLKRYSLNLFEQVRVQSHVHFACRLCDGERQPDPIVAGEPRIKLTNIAMNSTLSLCSVLTFFSCKRYVSVDDVTKRCLLKLILILCVPHASPFSRKPISGLSMYLDLSPSVNIARGERVSVGIHR
jgi:hypothetical protein